ncbi:unnamed protein product [Choristocarpus tenellus]
MPQQGGGRARERLPPHRERERETSEQRNRPGMSVCTPSPHPSRPIKKRIHGGDTRGTVEIILSPPSSPPEKDVRHDGEEAMRRWRASEMSTLNFSQLMGHYNEVQMRARGFVKESTGGTKFFHEIKSECRGLVVDNSASAMGDGDVCLANMLKSTRT